MLAKLTMVTPSKKKGEFGFCTEETNVPLNDFRFEIGSQTFQFGPREGAADVSQFRMGQCQSGRGFFRLKIWKFC